MREARVVRYRTIVPKRLDDLKFASLIKCKQANNWFKGKLREGLDYKWLLFKTTDLDSCWMFFPMNRNTDGLTTRRKLLETAYEPFILRLHA